VGDGNQDLASCVAHLESWVEVVMRTLATWAWKGFLSSLTRRAPLTTAMSIRSRIPGRRVAAVPSPARDDPGRHIGLGATPGTSFLWCRASPSSGQNYFSPNWLTSLPIAMYRI
jgi:hypothetical protein